MKRVCVICKGNIEVPNLHTKYCQECKVIIWEKQMVDWKKLHYNYTPKRNLLFCIKCFEKLPETSHEDRKYCSKCLVVRQSFTKKVQYRRKIELLS